MGEITIDNLDMAVADNFDDIDMISSLNAELLRIKAVHEMTRKKTRELMDQISTYEGRAQFVELARIEGEKISQGITEMAQARVDRIIDNAHRTVGPLHDEISAVEKEIGVLARDLEPVTAPVEVADQVQAGPEELHFGYSLGEPDTIDTTPVITREVTVDMEPAPPETVPYVEVKRGYAIIEPDEQPLVKREYSWREPQLIEEIPSEAAAIAPETVPDEPPLSARREYSLREPQADMELEETQAGSADIELPLSAQEHYGFSMREPEDSLPPVKDLDLAEIETEVTDMRFDVFIDSRHFEIEGGVRGPIHRHNWQIKVDVEVAYSNPEVPGYGKISAIVDTSLLRYDGILMNEAYPFNIIDPSSANIAKYFFNFLEDNLTLLGLVVKGVTLWENTEDQIIVTVRDPQLDLLLNHGDEDVFGDLRDKLNEQNFMVKAGASVKDRLGNMFKNK